MGVATLLVLLTHGKYFGSPTINTILAEGDVGVDIFLFLSAIGLYFSMKKNENTLSFYRRRFVRIIPSYLIIAIPLYAIRVFVFGAKDFYIYLCHILQVSFLLPNTLRYCTLWYVPFIIALYILYPVWYFLTKRFCSARKTIFLIHVALSLALDAAAIIFFPHIYVRERSFGLSLQLCRLPVFLAGCYCAFAVQENKQFNAIRPAIISIAAFTAVRTFNGLCLEKQSLPSISLLFYSKSHLSKIN